MFKYLLAASALALVSTPAAARDGAGYLGIEGGGIFVGNLDFDLDVDVDGEDFDFDDAVEVDLSPGYDIDAIAGYDFGMIRAELELGRKRLNVEGVEFSDELADEDDLEDVEFDIEEARSRVTTLMGNVLFDAYNNGGTSAYIGGGIGWADIKFEDAKDTAMAWQLIAGVRAPINNFIDAGIKYRFFNTSKIRFDDPQGEGEDFEIGLNGRLQTHSLLASLIFNFGGAPVAAPVVVAPAEPVVVDTAPPAPATQTCPDGSVILATAVCPPPPAPPAGERG